MSPIKIFLAFVLALFSTAAIAQIGPPPPTPGGGLPTAPGAGYAPVSTAAGTGNYTAQQVPTLGANTFTQNQTIPYVVTTLDVTNAAFSGGAKCDGTTDDHVALQAAFTAGIAAASTVVIPKGVTCRSTTALSISGNVKIVGQGSGIYFDPPSALGTALNISSSTGIEISGIAFSANTSGPGVLRAITATGSSSVNEHDNIHIHDDIVNGFQGCASGQNGGGVFVSGVSDVEVDHVTFENDGCPSSGTFPGGFEIANYTTMSYRLNIHDNTVLGLNTNFGVGLFNVNDSSIARNYINLNNFPNSGSVPTEGGYGVMTYGGVVCGGPIGATGLSRTSNVVTMAPTGTCGTVNVGDWIVLVGSTSVGGTAFDGDYVVTAATSSTLTTTLVNPVSLADDTGGNGAINYSMRGNKVQGNTILNTSGMGIYLQSTSDAVATDNIIRGACLYFNDTSLPCGGISINQGSRPVVVGNNVNYSLLDGIVLATSWDANISGNTVTRITNGGIRLRSNELRTTLGHNNVYDVAVGVKGDGVATYPIVDGNHISSFSSSGLLISNSANIYWQVSNNFFGGNRATGIPAVLVVSGTRNVFTNNTATTLSSGNGFDIRTQANTLTGNNCFNFNGGFCYITNGTSSDVNVYGGIINSVTGTGISDAGLNNSFQNIYMLSVTTPTAETGTGSFFAGIQTTLPATTFSAPQLSSTVATGTPPLTVTSTTQVANLDAATTGAFDHVPTGCSGSTSFATGIAANGNLTCGTAPGSTNFFVAASALVTGQTGTLANATIYTPAVAGVFELCAGWTVTSAGSAGATLQPVFEFLADGVVKQPAINTAQAATSAGATNGSSGVTSCQTFAPDISTNISLEFLVGGSPTTSPTYTYWYNLIRKQ